MNFIYPVIFVASLVTSSAFADSYVDVSGLYRDNDLVLKVTQRANHEMDINFGSFDRNGKVKIGNSGIRFSLDGNCDVGKTCKSASIDSDKILVAEVDPIPVDGGVHGLCGATTYTFSKSAAGNLIRTYLNVECPDRFAGTLSFEYSAIAL